jgi:hypothetical protein
MHRTMNLKRHVFVSVVISYHDRSLFVLIFEDNIDSNYTGFKNYQQIDYATDHGNSYADRERNSPSFFLHISQMLNVSTFGNTADIYAIVHLVPHAC